MTELLQHLRYAVRQWRRSPGFTAVAMLTLALGIGPNVAMFSVIWAVFLSPLPYPNGKQLVVLWDKTKGGRNPCRADDYLEYLRQSKSFQHLDFYSWASAHMTNTDPNEEPALGNFITPGFLTKNIGVPLTMGRDFLPEEGVAGKDQVVILTHLSWETRFHSDPNILGKQISIENKPYTVIGVETPGPHDSPGTSEFVVPLALNPAGHNLHWGNIFGRLKPGVTLAQAQAELNLIDHQLPAGRQGVPKEGWNISVEPLKNDWLDKKLERNLWLLLAAVGFVLLIACSNVANLLLARGASRRKEIAVRSAIGASRRQVIVQLITESLSLAIPGGAIGIGIGWVLMKLVVAIQPGLFEQVSETVIELNLPVLFFTVGVSVVSGILFGCAPAWHASNVGLTGTLNQGSQTVLGGKRGRTQGTLVVAEFALAITLLAGAGLAIHSFWKLTSIDLGFRADHVLTARLRTSSEHPAVDKIKADAQQLMEKLRVVPGVQSASLTTNLPLDGNDSYSFRISGKPVTDGNEPIAAFASVTPSYFETFGVRLLHGRLLSDSDVAGSTQVAVVSDGFVRRFLPDVDPLSEKIMFAAPAPYQKSGPLTEWQIVGVFREVKNSEHITDEMNPEVYLSFWQTPWTSVGLAVRTALDPAIMTKSIRGAVLAAQPTRMISHIDVLQQKIDDEFKGDRFGMVLFGGFSGLALLLAAIGVYGIAAFAIAQRQHEIGLRMALGAQRDQVVRLILVSAIKLAFLGICVGLVGVYLIGHLMRSTLYGIQTIDSASFVAASLLLVTAATVASYIPARRAAKVDPMVALRNQ